MNISPNPIEIIENYFEAELRPKTLSEFDGIDDDQWVDFAKHYLAAMQRGFAREYLGQEAKKSHAVRLYFEPTLDHEWAEIIEKRFIETPLLGYRAFLPEHFQLSREQVSRFLNPLKKHLLLADAVIIKDNFYHCFDMVADSVDRSAWRSQPNSVSLVNSSIARIRAYLPILAELRELIRSNALVFMPYYVTPTFPYANVPKEFQHYIKELRISDPAGEVWKGIIPAWEFDQVLMCWLNARLLGLDPVYLTDAMARIGGTLYLDGDANPSPAGDLLSVNILPFGGPDDIDLDTLLSIRRNEPVFAHVRSLTAQCKKELEENLGTGSTPTAARALASQILQDQLASLPSQKVISFAKKPTVSLAWRIGLAGATLGTSEIVGLLSSAVLDSSVGEVVLSHVAPRRRAIAYLNAAL